LINYYFISTDARKFFQGTEITDPARTTIFNRDKVIIDQNLGSGSSSVDRFVKEMENGSGVTIPALTPISKLSDGTIVAGDSDSANGQNFIGFTLVEIADGARGNCLLSGPNVEGAVSGLGFAPGDEIFLYETTGQLTNNPDSFTGNDDSIIKLGIADCAGGVASSTANDLILHTEVIIRP
jgi:hypothetical protein